MKKSIARPEPGTPEFDTWLREKVRQSFKDMENAPELDLLGISSGSLESLTNTDAEAFPDEPEEYMPHERVKIIVDNTKKKK